MGGSRRRLIVVSNRGPVGFARDAHGNRVARRGGGGLVTALRSLVSRHDVTWIASAMSEEDLAVHEERGGAAFEETAGDGSRYRLRFVASDPRAFDWHYNVVANPTLWFVQHQLWDLKYEPELEDGFHHAWREGYAAVNEAFAAAVLEELADAPEAGVFFHDYHLYLAPRLVREARPAATLMHFVHIPWPQPDAWTVLPEGIRRELHHGLLANDVVGFHTARWRRSFERCCLDFLGAECDGDVLRHDGRRTLTCAAPISVDPQEFDELADSDEVRERERALFDGRPERLVLRVDRTDPSKNVVRGFHAFALFLERHPELHGRVQMLALLDPSRQDIPEYAEYLGAVQRAAREVNDRFQTADWMPLDLQVSDDFPGSVAAYKQFDVLLVNAVFDGLNLVAKEAPLVNARDGVLILSENAGVHAELGEWALTINPFDVSGQADAIHEALVMAPGERRRRIEAIRAHVREHDLAAWIATQLEQLDRATGGARRGLARLRRG